MPIIGIINGILGIPKAMIGKNSREDPNVEDRIRRTRTGGASKPYYG